MGKRAHERRWTLGLLFVASGHLGLVILGATHTDLSAHGRMGEALVYYATLSGARSAYDFFASPVAAFPWATFQVTEAAGKVSLDVLESGANREAALRIRGVIGVLALQQDEAIRRSLAASVAGKVLARHPGAQSIVLRLETYALPSMRETREGKVPAWDLLYEARFVPRSKLCGAPRATEELP